MLPALVIKQSKLAGSNDLINDLDSFGLIFEDLAVNEKVTENLWKVLPLSESLSVFYQLPLTTFR